MKCTFDAFFRCFTTFFLLKFSDATPTEKYSRSGRKLTPNKRNADFYFQTNTTPTKTKSHKSNESNDSDSSPEQDDSIDTIGTITASKDFTNHDVPGCEIFQFSTPKKSDGMKRKAENTPKTPATALSRLSLNSPKTPRMMSAALRTQNIATPTETRSRIKKVLTKKAQHHVDESESESSADEHSDYEAEGSSDSDSTSDADATASGGDDDDDDDFEQPKQLASKRNAPAKQKLVELPATRTRGRPKKKPNEDDFIPDSDNYFLTAANKKVTSIRNNYESFPIFSVTRAF